METAPDVVRCGKCSMLQFRGARLSCGRCKWPLPSQVGPEPAPKPKPPPKPKGRPPGPRARVVRVADVDTVTWPLRHGAPLPTVEQMSYALLEEALRRCGGNRLAAAKALGIGKSTLYRRMRGQKSLPEGERGR